MKAEDWTIYVACTPTLLLKYQSEAVLKPMIGHSVVLSDEEKQSFSGLGYEFDGALSCLNPWWAELTCIEEIIRSADEPFIGIAQYRRPWTESALAPSREDVLYVTEPALFGQGVGNQLRQGHQSFDGVSLVMDAAKNVPGFPFNEDELDKLWSQPYFHGCSMARGPNKEFKTVMAVLFDAMMPIWDRNKDFLMSIEGYDRRSIAFIAERLMTGLILYRDKFFPSIEIMTAPIGYVS